MFRRTAPGCPSQQPKAPSDSLSAGSGMPCKCESVNWSKFIGEMGIRRPGLKNIGKPTVWVFPELDVCLVCGIAKFIVPEDELAELRLLAKGDAAASA